MITASPMDDRTGLTLSEASQLVRSKKVSPVELTRECLSRIERLNPKLNAFITVTADSALAEARQAEAEIQRDRWRGPLHGIPIALKDLVDTAGVHTTAGSGVFKDRVPTEDAEIVRRLKAAGAVFLGKLNLQEFAYGGSSAISHFGPVHNPWNLDYSPGGSSGGSAVAVAARLCFAAIGTDTGGSIRQPSAYCGVVGLKPTYGRVSTSGIIPLSWSLDHVGPITRTAMDAALMLEVIAGYDPQDTTSIDAPVPDYSRHNRRHHLFVAARRSARLLLRRTSSRDSGGHGSGSVGPENDYRLRAGRRAAFDGRHLLILDGSLQCHLHSGSVRLSQGLHCQESRTVPDADSEKATCRGGRHQRHIHSEPAPARPSSAHHCAGRSIAWIS